MKHIVSLSGGTASAVAANRVIERHGKENVILWFADTSMEDDDLYRFIDECGKYWGIEIIKYCDGRTPMQVADDEKMIFNQRRAPCSRILKQEPFKKFLATAEKPVTVHLGLDWQERHRHEAPRENYEKIDGVTVDYPLMWEPWSYNYQDEIKTWGIEPPRLYKYGFPHNNCSGMCFRQGKKEWLRLKTFFPERFEKMANWEQEARSHGDARSQYAIARDQRNKQVKPVTLRELESRWEPVEAENHDEDFTGCFCSY